MVMEYQKIHPGKVLESIYMRNNRLDSVSMAAPMDDVEPSEIDKIIGGSPINKTMSKKLGKLMKTHEGYWFNLQQNYNNAMNLEVLESKIKSAMVEKAELTPKSLKNELEQQKIILAAFSVGELETKISSAHAQKIVFLIDQEIYKGKPLFKPVRHKYGPNDFNLDSILSRMDAEDFIRVRYPVGKTEWRYRSYVMTPEGHSIGKKILQVMPDAIRSQISDRVEWALNMSVPKLKSEIDKKYPSMQPKQ